MCPYLPNQFVRGKRVASGKTRRGAALVYVTLVLPIVFLLVSLAVDFGRAQTSKLQLQSAIDAATRAAAIDILNFKSTATARATAKSVAAANTVNGHAITLEDGDIAFGAWNESTRTFSTSGETINAVRINATCASSRGTAIPTLFAAVAGRSSVDVRASATAYVSAELAPFNATGNVTFNHTGLSNGGSWRTDSYVGNLGTYSSGSSRINGNLLTQGKVRYNFTTPTNGQSGKSNQISNLVMGTIYSDNGADVEKQWDMRASGWGTYYIEYGGWNNPGASTQELSSSSTFTTPTMPSNNTNPTIPSTYLSGAGTLKDLSISDGSTVTLPGGTYTLNSLSVTNGSRVTFSGPVTIYLQSDLTVNAASMLPQANDAKYLSIQMCGADEDDRVTLTNLTSDFYADLNAPRTNVTFTQGNNGYSMLGRTRARNLTFNCTGNGGVHGDESLLRAIHLVR